MNMSKSRDIQAKMPSPKVIVKVLNSYVGFINDAEVWLLMLKRRNTSVHIWNEDEVNEMIILIRDSFIPAFKILTETLLEKLDEAESDRR
ncbi:MAG: nucleotidyltransferase substrate binding protein [Blautia sp.]|nr:nucleotidyltransferase substrate binding protein [Blautia sp.]